MEWHMNIILTSLSLGLLATTNPCILPLYPGFLAYISGNQASPGKGRYFLGVFVLLGVLTMMLAMGGIITLLSTSIGSVLAVIVPLADLLIMLLGVLLLLNINPFKQLPQIQAPGLSHPFINAYIYGLLYGPITLPCSGPLVVGIFAFSFTAGEALSKLAAFFWFGIGFGIPLLALSLLSGALQRQITRLFAIHTRKINILGGIILLAVGLYDVWSNLDLLRLYLR
jgi:cytochrome c-type biogenesis protein